MHGNIMIIMTMLNLILNWDTILSEIRTPVPAEPATETAAA
jgi:hypothetical protein